MTKPDDPGWETTNDTCPARLDPDESPVPIHVLGWQCELDPEHLDRGEPHTVTLVWFDPAPEPDCEACSDTGQFAGEPCPRNCIRAQQLTGQTMDNQQDVVWAGHSPDTFNANFQWWGGDE